MKTVTEKYIAMISFVLVTTNVIAQKLEMPIQSFLKTKNTVEYYEDTANLFTGRFAPLEVSGFTVEFKSVSIDHKGKKAFVCGYVHNTHSKQRKMGGIQIFKAKRSLSKLNNKISLGTTTFDSDKTKVDESGAFDLVFDFKKDDRLYFYFPFSWIVEFNIGKLLK